MPDRRLAHITALAHFGGLLRGGGDANYILNLIRALTLPELNGKLMGETDILSRVREAEEEAMRIGQEGYYGVNWVGVNDRKEGKE